jgi:sugar phosphate permease
LTRPGLEASAPSSLPLRRLLIAILIVMVSTLPVFLTAAAYLQLEADIGLTTPSLGAVTAGFFLTASLTSTPLGRLVDRIGWRLAMSVNSIVSAATLILISTTVRTPVVLGCLLIAAGVTYGITNPAANHALALVSATRRRGLVFGLKHAGIPASTLISGIAVPLLILRFGWRITFAASASLALLVLLLIRKEPDQPARRPEVSSSGRSEVGISQLGLVGLAIGSACATWAAVSLGTFLIAGSAEVGLTETQAGILLFLGSAASITARIIAGAGVDRRSAPGFTEVASMMAVGAVAFGLMSLSQEFGFAAAAISAFVFGWGWPGLLTFSVVNANPATAASSTAVTQAGVFFGAGVGPLTLGWIVEQWSFQAAWALVGILLVIASIIVAQTGSRIIHQSN